MLCHRHADADAYCASYTITAWLRRLAPNLRITVAIPEDLSLLAQRISRTLPLAYVSQPDQTPFDAVYVVDTGHASLLDTFGDLLRQTRALRVFIDHHPLHDSIRDVADHAIIDERATASCEVLWHLARAARLSIKADEAQALLTGIYADSQHLHLATARTLQVVAALCTRGAEPQKVRQLLTLPKDPSQAIARLKAAQRTQLYRAGNWIVATTQVGSFHAAAAKGLVDLGSDLALAAGGDGETRVSLRATQEFWQQTQVHLGQQVAEPLAQELHGSGGGHPTAASLTVHASLTTVQEHFLQRLGDTLHASITPLPKS